MTPWKVAFVSAAALALAATGLFGHVRWGLAALALLTVLLLLRAKFSSSQGRTRFASAGDLSMQGMFEPSPTGIVIGKMRGKFIYLSGPRSPLLAAPARSGKGTGIVIPNLLSYQGSIVVLCLGPKNFNLTSGWRKHQGQDVYLFDPFAEDERSHRWNPLHDVADDPASRFADLALLAESLYPEGWHGEKVLMSQARNAFLAFALYLFEKRDDERSSLSSQITSPTLGRIRELSASHGDDLKAAIRSLSHASFLSERARQAFSDLLSQDDDAFASIVQTLNAPLTPFANPAIDAATSASDFSLKDVRKKPMTVYVVVRPDKLAASSLFARLLFSQLVKLNTGQLPQQHPDHTHQCLLLMDEFTILGRVDMLVSAAPVMAGCNLRLFPIIKSLSQLDAVYGKDIARPFANSHALRIAYTPREQIDADEYSQMIGGPEGRAAFILAHQLKAMHNDKLVFFCEGMTHAVMCEKIRYYRDKFFTARLLPKVDVPSLRVH